MNHIVLILIVVILSLCILSCILSTYIPVLTYVPNDEPYENMKKIAGAKRKWNRSRNCKSYMNSTTYDCLADHLIEQTSDPNSADIIFPCGYNNIENEIRSLPHLDLAKKTKSQVVFIIEGADEFTAKDRLWRNLLKYHGMKKAITISPMTYILSGDERNNDMSRLIDNHKEGKLYIMKKNIQRQEGLKITSSLEDIMKNEDKYILVQELVQNSYLIDGRKINLRVYIVVVCHQNTKKVLVFNNGFMYYTKKKFDVGDNSKDNHVTTGYIDRDVYVRNPLTLVEFRKYLDLPTDEKFHPQGETRILSEVENNIRNSGLQISDVVFDRIHNMIKDIFVCMSGCICTDSLKQNNAKNPIYSDYCVEIFGADVAIDSNLMPLIMEINKGPDLNPKDDRDLSVKKNLISSVFGIMNLSDTNKGDDLHVVLKM